MRDLLRQAPDGRGMISILELADVQDRPRLFSTFLMWLLAELYEELPERGDLEKPLLVFFFDEAHFLFDDASKALEEQVTHVVRLIRSKGVGIFFVTQTPKDVPADVLAQLGNRVQHALRAHTPDDAKKLKATVGTFPRTPFYDLEETLTTLGTGEAVVSVLAPNGAPAPVVAARMLPPASRMAPLSEGEFAAAVAGSALGARLAQPDRPRERARDARGADEPGGRGWRSPGGTTQRSHEPPGRSGSRVGYARAARAEEHGSRGRRLGRRRSSGGPRRTLQVRDQPRGAAPDSRGRSARRRVAGADPEERMKERPRRSTPSRWRPARGRAGSLQSEVRTPGRSTGEVDDTPRTSRTYSDVFRALPRSERRPASR